MLSIRTNLPEMVIQNALKTSTFKLNSAVEKLTTGYKINSAKDNAANYSISMDMTTKINAYQIAEENCAMGLDFIGTASDSLDLISNNLTKLRALAEQAANGTYGKQSINVFNKEAVSLINEIYRSKNSVVYNEQKVFGDTTLDTSTCGAKGLEINEQGFLKEIKQRDTSAMTGFWEVDENQLLAVGTYSISEAWELTKLSTMVMNDKISAGCEFVLGADIDLSEFDKYGGLWAIGNYWQRFKGTFDGNGYKISNLNQTRLDTSTYQGLFGCVENATIKNVAIESGNIQAIDINHGSLVGCAVNSTISNCYSNANVNSSKNPDNKDKSGNIGGLVGLLQGGSIEFSYTTGNVSCEGTEAGGLVGILVGSISNCFATGDVKASNGIVGGLIGDLSGNSNVNNCFALGNITSTGDNIGGLIGLIGTGKVSNSHAAGVVSGKSKVGGLVGNSDNPAQITNSYTTSRVNSTGDYTGGLIGYSNGTIVSNCYIQGKSESIKGIITGYASGGSFTNCYYNASYNGMALNAEGTTTLTNCKTDDSGAVTMQVGIDGSSSNKINIDSKFNFGNFRDIAAIGIQSSKSLEIIDNVINLINTKQINLGASQNRLESAMGEISTNYENLVSARSTLRDADITKVSSEYIKQQILQQANATLLATVNQTPALALRLLGIGG